MNIVDESLGAAIDSILEIMSNCKRRLTNRAMLRNLTPLAPILPNVTRGLVFSYIETIFTDT